MSADTSPRGPLRPFSVAPMMERTDRHYRYLARLFSRHALLYTEMVTTGAVLHGDLEHLLGFAPEEHPIALQLGGSEPRDLEACARIAAERGYDEINLNVGCPSDRVQDGRFGACLMAEPERVADCVAAMRSAVDLPVTVKHRIGIDDRDRYEDMREFVETVAAAGCDRFSVHARIAVLGGLSPKQNRTVPPLRYEDVHRLKRDLPHLRIEINGGLQTLTQAHEQMTFVDGVMIGRAAYDHPDLLGGVDAMFFGDDAPPPSTVDVIRRYLPYVESRLALGSRLSPLTRHMINLFGGRPRARLWRQRLSTLATRPGAGVEVIEEALKLVEGASQD